MTTEDTGATISGAAERIGVQCLLQCCKLGVVWDAQAKDWRHQDGSDARFHCSRCEATGAVNVPDGGDWYRCPLVCTGCGDKIMKWERHAPRPQYDTTASLWWEVACSERHAGEKLARAAEHMAHGRRKLAAKFREQGVDRQASEAAYLLGLQPAGAHGDDRGRRSRLDPFAGR